MSRRILLVLVLAGCGTTATGPTTAVAAKLAHWRVFAHVKTPVDLIARPDRSLLVAANERLQILSAAGKSKPFAAAYRGSGGEPYIALAPRGCFGAGTVYALKATAPQAVVAVRSGKRPRLLAMLAAPGLANGIAFDTTGRFGHRLLVTVNAGSATTVYEITCTGRVITLTTSAPRMEGGIAVAPAAFGRFGGDLIAPDELSGRIFAVTPAGRALLVASSGLPFGQDVGVESEGFLPPGDRPYDVFLADRLTPGNPHPGDDVILRLGSATLRTAGVRGGDLLVATEGGALVDAVRCSRRGCTTRYVAAGPKVAHAEGHIAVIPR